MTIWHRNRLFIFQFLLILFCIRSCRKQIFDDEQKALTLRTLSSLAASFRLEIVHKAFFTNEGIYDRERERTLCVNSNLFLIRLRCKLGRGVAISPNTLMHPSNAQHHWATQWPKIFSYNVDWAEHKITLYLRLYDKLV